MNFISFTLWYAAFFRLPVEFIVVCILTACVFQSSFPVCVCVCVWRFSICASAYFLVLSSFFSSNRQVYLHSYNSWKSICKKFPNKQIPDNIFICGHFFICGFNRLTVCICMGCMHCTRKCKKKQAEWVEKNKTTKKIGWNEWNVHVIMYWCVSSLTKIQ